MAAANFSFAAESAWLRWGVYPLVLLAQGLWLDRIYIVGHEATHRKLFPKNRPANELAGILFLMPLAVPLQVFRKIHVFHHGFNRRDEHTASLDTFVTRKPPTRLKRIFYHALWLVGVFGSGYFWHSLGSIVIFLFLPTRVATRISPAFKNWTERDRAIAWGEFLLGVGFHLTFYFIGGWRFWLVGLALPMLVFAWIWSLLVYIFHYDTSIGKEVRFNVRSLDRNWFFSWLLMNFNEHTTHHAYPNLPWYELPAQKQELPARFASNQNVRTVRQAVWQQIKGPRIGYEPHSAPGENGRRN